ncbi:trans-2,3-dihydro-3-hydroxyanthranilate isomerase [Rhizobium subbaraonis]|uniref:Trans-2,3-dihydro-3-hydroxyanthranilate isomerase n=1 Tax=Rhizobium subbaraonis TaxID=908946 RepID=A0A285UIP2_9HYPH|nr:PhzF family phenazine biosynthesis protein [Rhizobium subbaraonis]SOC40121.1 trans-2,3-dihydro-3-hydroxyanthranilate isomerase [Rhizobium subbaraonis]
MARRYAVYDVFTDRKLAGNPLAVVFDADGLDDAAMQAIATEFNLSETVFVHKAEVAAHAARLRIFTPAQELPFAGHPTVGAAIAIAEASNGERTRPLDLVSVLEENIGPVRCAVKLPSEGAPFAEFDLPRKSVRLDAALDRQAIADAFGLKVTQIGFENHVPSLWSAGVAYLMVPVHDLAAASDAEFDPMIWQRCVPFAEGRLASAYLYCRGAVNHLARFHARMFSSDMGREDPATGSAVAALSGALQLFDQMVDGHHPILIEQGVEMERPSMIHLHLDVAAGHIVGARIGGQAVRVAGGWLEF